MLTVIMEDMLEYDIRNAIADHMRDYNCSARESIYEINEILKKIAQEIQREEKEGDDIHD